MQLNYKELITMLKKNPVLSFIALCLLLASYHNVFAQGALNNQPNYFYSPNNTLYYAPYNLPYQAPINKLNNQNNYFHNMQNWFRNQFQNGNWQQGDNNIFQDAKGFYKLMGNGRTKWKFYFDVDFQTEMDAWIKGNAKASELQRRQFNHGGNYYSNGAGQPNWHYQQNYQPYAPYQYAPRYR